MNPSFVAEDTIAAIATPKGEGAIGLIRLSGEKAISIADSIIRLSNGRSLSTLDSWRMALGELHTKGQSVDEVLASVFRNPHSFTGEDMVEISCHGAPVILKQILEGLVSMGARLAERGEFSYRAYLNGKMDLLQAEAIAELISAKTEASSHAALANLNGKLSAELKKVRENLLEASASLEVAMDHSDDPTVGTALTLEQIGKNIGLQAESIEKLVESYQYGRLLRDGIKIAIVGKPNAGKSSLLNCILGSERAIVSALPGTTRDTIEEGFDLFGIPAILVDTAGLRDHTLDPIEKIGIERTKRALERADAAIVMVDGSTALAAEDFRLAKLIEGKPAVIALSKEDLPQKVDSAKMDSAFPGIKRVSISVIRNHGIAELLKALYAQVASSKNGDRRDALVLTSVRHKDCLESAGRHLRASQELIRQESGEECVALEIRDALDRIGELAGETAAEDILNKIFSGFCVGK